MQQPSLRRPAPPRLTRLRPALMAGLLGCALAGCASAPTQPLHQQLGGVQGIDAIARGMLQRMSTDPRTRRTFDGINLKTLGNNLAAHLCQVADGPCVYEGETMAKSHADLNLGGSEFDATVQFLRDELDAAGVSTAAKNELLRRLAPMRRDIVQPGR
ncbi:MAG: group 1 truncated hemoglobin [Burkholderiales bacterium]|nr:group 1 truncated hemoglobin [Burkholderiales bacterium]MBH2017429.1 group 1 truncated hemoglobin [Burkholderiales bacterium]